MNRYEQITYKGHHINIYYDDCPESPREWSNLGTFYTAHRRYRPEKEFDEHFDFDEVCDGRPGNIRKSFLQKHVALNLFLYDHSGLSISSGPFSCRWDSGWFGIVAVSVEQVKKEYGWKSYIFYDSKNRLTMGDDETVWCTWCIRRPEILACCKW